MTSIPIAACRISGHLEHYEKEDESSSLSIWEIIDSEGGGT